MTSEKKTKQELVPLGDIIECFQENIKKQQANISETEAKIALIKQFQGKDLFSLTNGEIKTILGLTCYGNIGYCCGFIKTCVHRDAVLNLLQITPEQYIKAKNTCQQYLLKREIK